MQRRTRIAIFTLRDLTKRYGSTFRPLSQADGLRRNGFDDFTLCSGKLDVIPSLVHAHQDAIYHVSNHPYIADLHGVSWITAQGAIDRMAFSYKKYRYRLLWLPRQKRKEEEAYSRAKCLICAGKSIQDMVKHLNRTEIVRNAVDIGRYGPPLSTDLRVALVGPFFEGHENVFALEMLASILKLDTKTQYLVIGPIEPKFAEPFSRFRNVFIEPTAENFVETLRRCSILLCPYPEKTPYGGAKIKILEAAACSIPIVSTPRAVADFNKELVLFGNTPAQLVDRIRYLSDEETRQDLGKRLRLEIEQNHDHVKESRKLVRIYEEFSDS